MTNGPDIICAEPPYELFEYLNGEYRHKDILVRHPETVTEFGKENERIEFRKIPAAKAISIYYKGAYDNLGEAYAYIMKYAEANG